MLETPAAQRSCSGGCGGQDALAGLPMEGLADGRVDGPNIEEAAD
jgi:hypothetical protein